MTHILKADKDHFRMVDLKELATDSKYKGKNNIPVRILARVFCFVTRDGMYKISQIAREEKLSQPLTLKLDTQMENEFIYESDPVADQLKISLITRDGYYMFMDCSELHKDMKLKINKQCFFSGNVIIIEHDIACLKLTCITPAEGLDINLYNNTRAILRTMDERRALEQSQKPKNQDAMDVEPLQQKWTEDKEEARPRQTDIVDLDVQKKAKSKQQNKPDVLTV